MTTSTIAIEFLGSGDAFGSGGRLQACVLVSTENVRLLLDCGTTALIAMKRRAIDPASVDAIVLTHLHGDHFGGIPFLLLDARFSRRTRPLVIAGPAGTQERIEAAEEVLFPGSRRRPTGFELRFVELRPRVPTPVGPAEVTPFEGEHASGAPSYIVRAALGRKVIVYSGDTGWTDRLVEAVRDADLLICEAYSFAKPIKHHLDYQTLLRNRDRLRCGRVLLTHMGPEMLARLDEIELECAKDGLTLAI